MPVHKTTKDGKPAYKYGETGKAYTYVPGDRRSVQLARQKAEKQGRAIEHEIARREES